MCGIAGVLGRRDAPSLVKQTLRILEYRGYDSCGIAWPEGDALRVARAVGPVSGLEVASEAGGTRVADVALGHTRWATHGGVTETNAHPHLSCDGRCAVVHNGVLLNFESLRKRLTASGHTLRSETDSEALVHLWEETQGDGLARLAALSTALEGTYSVALLDAAEDAVYVTKRRNPLWVAHADGATWFASDPVALRAHAAEAVPLEDGDHGRLTRDGFQLVDSAGRDVQRTPLAIRHLDDRMDKAGYEHFMLKEVHETPSAVNRLLAAHVLQRPPYVDLGLPATFLRRFRRVLCLGAGTSHHAGLLTTAYLQRLANVPAQARPTPEYKDETDVPEPSTMLLALSQSGETLDTLQALHRLRSHPHPVLAFTNHPTSTIGREADHAVALQSGIEVSVAATKTFLSQALLGYLLALAKARNARTLGDGALAHAAQHLVRLPRALEQTLLRADGAKDLARRLAPHNDLFVLAKGLLLPVALEGALKLKEIAYQHAEAYPAGELKHGPFALLTRQTPVVFLVAPGPDEASLRNSLQEVRARGAPVLVLAMEGAQVPDDGEVWWLPPVEPDLHPFVFAEALHLLSYWVAKARGLPIDRPRNLAKSVTVE